MCVRLHVRALVGARVGACGCGRPCGARTGTRTCVRVREGAHVWVRMGVRLRGRAAVSHRDTDVVPSYGPTVPFLGVTFPLSTR